MILLYTKMLEIVCPKCGHKFIESDFIAKKLN